MEANLSFQQMEAAIPKIDRRIADLESFNVDSVKAHLEAIKKGL